MAIKPPGGGSFIPTVSIPQSADTAPKKTQEVPASFVNPEAVAKALKDFNKLRNKLKKPFMSGAAGLFTDNVMFPSDLMDPTNPANDPKYLHLMTSVLGMSDWEPFLVSADYIDEDEDESDDDDESDEKPPFQKKK